jgi:hypothetical protein
MKTRPIILALAFAVSNFVQAEEFQLHVTANHRDYDRAMVTASVPGEFPKTGRLKSRSDQAPDTSFQRDGDGNVVFFLRALKKGERASYVVVAEEGAPRARAESRAGKVALDSGGKKVLVYQGAESQFPRPDIKPIFKRGGYIHPVYSPSGRLVTDDFPPNHVHHHGIWAPWTKTIFEGRAPDFWNMGEGKGKVEVAGYGSEWSGPVHSGFTAEHRFVDLTADEPKTALNESWKVASYHIPGADYFLFDLVITQTCATAVPLRLPKYHYGGLGVRGNWAWNGANKCFFLTSNGETNRVKGNDSQAKWCHMGGEVDGALTGMAILCHPENFRAPQGMRLHPTEPFFCYAPSQGGDWAIEPGKPYVARYRFVVKDGAPNQAELDRLWDDYANPPTVQIVPAGD